MTSGSRLRWPAVDPAWGHVPLRPFRASDVAMVVELATDPHRYGGLLREHQEIGGRRRDMSLDATLRPGDTDRPDER